jgi:hypothetical protein
MMIYKSTCFRALALVVFLSSSVFSYSQVSNADVLFSGTFGGATNVDGTTYSIPTGSEAWAGFANEDVSLYPLSFTNGGDVTFTGSTAGTDVEVYFRFEYNPYPDTEPSFSTETVTVSGTTEASYTVDIPSQGGNTFSSFLLYINTIDSPVTLTNVTLTSTDVADPCSEITCTGEEVCVNGECVISGCIDVNADNFNSNATSDDGTCTYSLSVLTVTTTVCDEASSVQLTGPWWGWDPSAGPSASDNGDGTWTFTFDPAPIESMEYLLVVDGVQENLVASNSASEDWSCTPITDYFSYANRQWAFGSGNVSNVYGTCGACEDESTSLTITTTVCDAASSVMMTGPWWGWDPNAGPVASDNGDGTWTFTFDPAPADNMEYLLVVDGVQEDLLAANAASEDWSCTPITDYFSYANRQWTAGSGDVSNVYGQCGACEDGSDDDILGCIDENAVNYSADATVQSYDQYLDILCTYASCDATPGNGCMYADSFGFFNEFFGPSECELYGGTSCSDNNDLSGCIDENAVNYDSDATEQALDQYGNILCTYDSCESSPGNGCVYADSFGAFASGFGPAECELYGGMSCEVETTSLTITTTVCDAASSVQMTGPWWGWDPNAGPVASDNADGTWTFTFDPAPTDNMEYLLVVDGVQEDLVAAGTASDDWSCTPVTDYWSYANRQWAVGSGDVSNVYGQCGDCVEIVLGCLYLIADNYNSLANDDDGSCIFPINVNDCAADIDGDNVAGTSDLLLLLSGFGVVCE